MNFFSFKLLIHYLVLTIYYSKRLFAIEDCFRVFYSFQLLLSIFVFNALNYSFLIRFSFFNERFLYMPNEALYTLILNPESKSKDLYFHN